MPLKGGKIGDWIKDFKKSDAPQFKDKSDEKKRDMAIAAYLDAKNEERSVSENAFRPPHITLAHMNRMKKHNISFKQADDMLKNKKKKPEVEKKPMGEATAKTSYFIGHKHAKRAGINVKVHGQSFGGTGDDVTLSHPDKKKLQKYVDNHLDGEGQGIHVKESFGKPTRLKTYLNESTNWKGTEHIGLTRYSAQKGFGLQLTQNKRMGDEKFRLGAHISMPMKDVPKLIKSLQKVMKADPKAQLGDDE